MRRTLSLLFLAGFIFVGAMPGVAQTKAQFRARLSTVPIDVAMQSTIAGSGSATATLIEQKLSVTGAFANLKSPATLAKIHVAPKGMRGPAVFDLTVSKATSGTLSGEFELTSSQLRDAKEGRFYIQVHSEKAPEGNLWGWLLPQETRR